MTEEEIRWKEKLINLNAPSTPLTALYGTDYVDFSLHLDYSINAHTQISNNRITINMNAAEKYGEIFYWPKNVNTKAYYIIYTYLDFLSKIKKLKIGDKTRTAAARMFYNIGVNRGYFESKMRFTKENVYLHNGLREKQIKKLATILELPYDNNLFDDIDIEYYPQIDKEFETKVKSINWKEFLLNLLPEREIADFDYCFSYDNNIKSKMAHYSSDAAQIVFFMHTFNNNFSSFVNTAIHEFCHHLERERIFTHYNKVEHPKTHTPLFYAAIKILQNKSIIKNCALSKQIYSKEEILKDCIEDDIKTLCADLCADYEAIININQKNQ